MGYGKDVQAELRQPVGELRERIPGVFEAFGGLHKASMFDGALDRKTKELIALAIAVTRQCDGCMSAHAKGAARSGASAEEVAEMLGVAIQMNGGPATVYGSRVFAAFQEYASD